ncbi:MAG: imidazoleglycerol-phosphate dehydratase HisB [Candidatus Sumerlaeia bacterium]
MTKARTASVERNTRETQISMILSLDGSGAYKGSVGLGFMDHMLELLARHGRFDLEVKATGDLHVDAHHLVEDLGIVLGQALKDAAGDKAGMARFGRSSVPMEETLAECVLDFCGRPYLAWKAKMPKGKVGEFDIELAEDFFRAVAMNAGLTLHMILHDGRNAHHIIEAMFKALARALAESVRRDPSIAGVLSTKGKL